MYSSKGFTLLEMIIVIAISAILLGVAVPSFKSMIEDNKIMNAGNSIQNTLMFARNQSVSLINYVTVCPLKDNGDCGTDWINGLDVFIDADEDQKLDSDEVLLKTATSFNNSDTLVFPSAYITFTPDGQITDSGKTESFRFCSGESQVNVKVTFSGQAKVISENITDNCK